MEEPFTSVPILVISFGVVIALLLAGVLGALFSRRDESGEEETDERVWQIVIVGICACAILLLVSIAL